MEQHLEEVLSQVSGNKDYVVREYNSIRKNWGDMFVGVVDHAVRYHDMTMDGLLAKIRSDRGSTEGIFIMFIPSKQGNLIV